MVTDDRSRGQLILIGAIALAFIILGIVVVFNGVVYTETLSSGSTSQSATTAEKTELEIEQAVGCFLEHHSEWDEVSDIDEGDEEFEQLRDRYRDSLADSQPAVVDIELDSDNIIVTYDSNEVSYTKTIEEIDTECPA